MKILINTENDEVYKRMTKFFRQEDIDFEIQTEAAKNVRGFLGERSSSEQNGNGCKKIDERISHIFITVGIPAHIKGYQFLRSAIKLAVENPGIINSITKQLYPAIAKQFATTPSKVERAIRHAIEVGWNRGRADRVNDIFGVKAFDRKDKPTNGEFIALIADKMLLEGA